VAGFAGRQVERIDEMGEREREGYCDFNILMKMEKWGGAGEGLSG